VYTNKLYPARYFYLEEILLEAIIGDTYSITCGVTQMTCLT